MVQPVTADIVWWCADWCSFIVHRWRPKRHPNTITGRKDVVATLSRCFSVRCLFGIELEPSSLQGLNVGLNNEIICLVRLLNGMMINIAYLKRNKQKTSWHHSASLSNSFVVVFWSVEAKQMEKGDGILQEHPTQQKGWKEEQLLVVVDVAHLGLLNGMMINIAHSRGTNKRHFWHHSASATFVFWSVEATNGEGRWDSSRTPHPTKGMKGRTVVGCCGCCSLGSFKWDDDWHCPLKRNKQKTCFDTTAVLQQHLSSAGVLRQQMEKGGGILQEHPPNKRDERENSHVGCCGCCSLGTFK